MKPFANLGMKTLSMQNTGGTDHLSFDAVGLPGFQFIQDPLEYDTRTHHSNMDSLRAAQVADMMQNAVIVATFVYQTANRDQKLPRKPLPKPSRERPALVQPRTAHARCPSRTQCRNSARWEARGRGARGASARQCGSRSSDAAYSDVHLAIVPFNSCEFFIIHRTLPPRPVLPVAIAQWRSTAARSFAFGLIGERVDRPGQAPGPVVGGDGRRRVDAIAPAEDVLDRESSRSDRDA